MFPITCLALRLLCCTILTIKGVKTTPQVVTLRPAEDIDGQMLTDFKLEDPQAQHQKARENVVKSKKRCKHFKLITDYIRLN